MENKRIYVVIAHGGAYENVYTENFYVGPDKTKAFDFFPDEAYNLIVVELWYDGIKVQTWENEDGSFRVEYNKVSDLENYIKQNEEEIMKKKIELEHIKEAVKR